MRAHRPSRVRVLGRQTRMLPCARVTCSRGSIWTRGSHPNIADLARLFCAHSRHIPVFDQCQREVGWAQLGRAMSLASIISTSRGRMRGVGATCTAPTTYGHPKRMTATECCKIGVARTSEQRLRLSPRSDRLGLGFRQQIDGSAGRVRHFCIATQDPRDDHARVPRAG